MVVTARVSSFTSALNLQRKPRGPADSIRPSLHLSLSTLRRLLGVKIITCKVKFMHNSNKVEHKKWNKLAHRRRICTSTERIFDGNTSITANTNPCAKGYKVETDSRDSTTVLGMA